MTARHATDSATQAVPAVNSKASTRKRAAKPKPAAKPAVWTEPKARPDGPLELDWNTDDFPIGAALVAEFKAAKK